MSYTENVSAFAAYRMETKNKRHSKPKTPKKHLTVQDNNKATTQHLTNGFARENHHILETPTGQLTKNAKKKLKNRLNLVTETPVVQTPTSHFPTTKNELPNRKRNISEQSAESLPAKKKEKSLQASPESSAKKQPDLEHHMQSHAPQKKIQPVERENFSSKKKGNSDQNVQRSTPKKKVIQSKFISTNKQEVTGISSEQKAGQYVSLSVNLPAKDDLQSTTDSDPPTNDSIEDGKDVFKWLISPVDFDEFFEKYWEKNPCLIQRNDPAYFSKLISCSVIDQMLLSNHVEFTKNIDITSYVDGIRNTLNPEGRAMPSVVWGHYEDGCSIRLLNPQTFIQPIYVMNATLQEFFHCMVGTNVYLTPPNSQGFAPHYDDIEAFVIQIEGQKRWKLYNPRSNEEALARFSSKNFDQDEIGQPILDKVLRPGDVLYFPRGTIHQASTQPGYHSLHITVSMYQKHSYADLFEIILPKMISRAIKSEIELRRGLPLGIWHNLGKIFMGDDEYTNEREEIMKKCEKVMQKVLRHADLDEAVDLMAKRFQHDALPPALTPAEKERTIFGAKTVIDSDGLVKYGYDITLDSHVRLIRANVLRVVEEEDAIRLYYYVDNSKEYHEYEPNFIEIEEESVGIIQQLVKEYPDYICVSELEGDSDEDKLSVIQGLFERGLLMVDEPSSK